MYEILLEYEPLTHEVLLLKLLKKRLSLIFLGTCTYINYYFEQGGAVEQLEPCERRISDLLLITMKIDDNNILWLKINSL